MSKKLHDIYGYDRISRVHLDSILRQKLESKVIIELFQMGGLISFQDIVQMNRSQWLIIEKNHQLIKTGYMTVAEACGRAGEVTYNYLPSEYEEFIKYPDYFSFKSSYNRLDFRSMCRLRNKLFQAFRVFHFLKKSTRIGFCDRVCITIMAFNFYPDTNGWADQANLGVCRNSEFQKEYFDSLLRFSSRVYLRQSVEPSKRRIFESPFMYEFLEKGLIQLKDLIKLGRDQLANLSHPVIGRWVCEGKIPLRNICAITGRQRVKLLQYVSSGLMTAQTLGSATRSQYRYFCNDVIFQSISRFFKRRASQFECKESAIQAYELKVSGHKAFSFLYAHCLFQLRKVCPNLTEPFYSHTFAFFVSPWDALSVGHLRDLYEVIEGQAAPMVAYEVD